jgi:glutamate/tyrosine decarboxylase-like PLP-dependent enzyme
MKQQFELAEQFIQHWQSLWGDAPNASSLDVPQARFDEAWQAYTQRLLGNYPFQHARYAGQMLKPPHPVAVLGYLTAMMINPNNHALDGGPPTSHMEKEVVQQFAAMFGLPQNTLGHLTGGGTVANLEALWVARCIHPNKKIAFSADAHYTHERMCAVLGIESVKIPCNTTGHMDLQALETALQAGDIGTVVFTLGTTGLGIVDPLADALDLQQQYGFRIHVDAAYGGFFALLKAEPDFKPARHFRAIAQADSVVIDPHKHGLQPYGCGCVLFSDPSVGQFYKHDSPYTYFSSEELHLGEISLECSRPGAAAGALWLTLRCLPLKADDGLGLILKACLKAAKDFYQLMQASEEWQVYTEPELDIVAYYPNLSHTKAVDQQSQALFDAAMNSPENPIFVSVYNMASERLVHRNPSLVADTPRCRILRSVLMKPEHERYTGALHEGLSTYLKVLS